MATETPGDVNIRFIWIFIFFWFCCRFCSTHWTWWGKICNKSDVNEHAADSPQSNLSRKEIGWKRFFKISSTLWLFYSTVDFPSTNPNRKATTNTLRGNLPYKETQCIGFAQSVWPVQDLRGRSMTDIVFLMPVSCSAPSIPSLGINM